MPSITTPPNLPDPRTLSQAEFEYAVANFLAYIPLMVSDINAFIAYLTGSTLTYLGGFSTPPTLDNSGNALVDGQTYLLTTTNVLYVRSGGAWVNYGISNPTISFLSGLTNANTIPLFKAALGIDTSLSPNLSAISALTSAADRVPFFTGSGTAALMSFSSYMRGLMANTSLTDLKTAMALNSVENTLDENKPISTAVQTALNGKQQSNTNLSALAGLVSEADKAPYFTGSGAAALMSFSSFMRGLMSSATLTALKTSLGLEQVSNTSDLTKPISNATQTALNAKLNANLPVPEQLGSGAGNCFYGTPLSSLLSGANNVAMGNQALRYTSAGNSNTAVGFSAIVSATLGDMNTGLGAFALSNISSGSNNIGVGYNAQVPTNSVSNQVRIGNSAITYAGIQVAWTVTSDSHWKTNISPVPLGLYFINQLNPVSYTRKNDGSGKTEYGLIAQDLQKLLVDSGADNSGMLLKDDDGLLHLRYNDLLAPMIKAIQELSKEVDFLKCKLA